jgi:predicted ribosome quality control (RQC) complex YloA/Tae2 family protein
MASLPHVVTPPVVTPPVVAALPAGLVPAKVQKARVDGDVCSLEIFAGRKRFIDVHPGRVDVADARPVHDDADGGRGDGGGSVDGGSSGDDGGRRTPPALQGLVRKELVPSILTAIDIDEVRGLLRLRFARKDAPARVLLVEHDARAPRWLLLALTDDGERILSCAPAARADDGRDLRRGRLYEPPRRAPQAATPAPSTGTSSPTAVATAVPPALRAARDRLKGEIERLVRLDRALARDIAKHGDAARLQEDGELLKTALHAVRRGDDHVDVIGFDGAPRSIALDVTKDARANLSALFSRAKKARTAVAHATPRRAEVQLRLAALTPLRAHAAAVVGADDDEDDVAAVVAAILEALAANTTSTAPSARRVAARGGERRPWRAFLLAQDGGDVVVRVGRGARDNDALVKAARGNDLWLHARDAVGAHVVVPSSGGPVPDGLVRDAALLAAHFSARRGERHVDVQHTRVKHLKKPGAGAPAGLFLVGHESVLHVRVDEERIKALLRCEVPAT